MSLASCIKQFGKALDQRDIDAIQGLVANGMGELEAVDSLLARATTHLPDAPAGTPGVWPQAREVAQLYAESAGIPYTPPDRYAPLDEDRAAAIADEFERMEHKPNDPKVKAAYQALIDETLAQFEFVLGTGLEIEFFDANSPDPYPSGPNEVLADVRDNNHIWVFKTEAGFGSDSTFDVSENPLLAETKYEIDGHKLVANDVFRIVHDYFGHIAQGAGFRARGEEAAWQSHAAMFTPLARQALTSETRGQNSWLNYGPHGDTNRTAQIEDTIFADQKIGLMPRWTSEDGRISAHERRRRFEADRRENRTGFEGAIDAKNRVELVHYSHHPHERIDPSRWGTGLSRFTRSEANRRAAGAPDRAYFGIESANEHPYRKESGLGNSRLVTHVPGDLIYDVVKDPEGLVTRDDIETERAIFDAGYIGYYRDHPNLGKTVAIFDEVSVSQEAITLSQAAIPKGKVELGDFIGREYADGTMVVRGDVDAIRAELPEGVRGTPVPEGLRFTPNMAPRAAASLRGEQVSYSRGGKVVRHRKNKSGKYIGASEANNTPAKMKTWRKKFKQLAEEGAPGRFWYENSGSEIYTMTGGNMDEARKFIALLAIYSPQAKVDANSTFALRAWAQYKAGETIEVKTGSQDRQATEVLYSNKPWGGEKTNNFFNNLLREVDPSTATTQGATIDMWMMRAGFYDHDAPNDSEYAFMENETNRLAEELGWEPQQVQAAVWVGMKARMENDEVKKRTEKISRKNKWIKGGGTHRKILDASKHAMNWVKQGMAHELTPEDTQVAKFDFSDGVRRHVGQVSWEARPSTHTTVLPGIHTATYEQQLEFHRAIQDALSDDAGVDLLAQRLGMLADGSVVAPGVWEGDVSPSTQLDVSIAPAGGGVMWTRADGETLTNRAYTALKQEEREEWYEVGPRIPSTAKTDAGPQQPDMEFQRYRKSDAIDPAQRQVLDTYSAVMGLLLRQDGVGYHKPFMGNSYKQSNGIELNIGRVFTPEEAVALEKGLHELMAPDSFALISSPEGMRVVNFDDTVDNKKFHGMVEKTFESALGDDVEARNVYFTSDGNLVENDWEKNPNGEDYRKAISESGRSDILGWSTDVLYPKVQAVHREFSEKYGWGETPGLDFSEQAQAVDGTTYEQEDRANIQLMANNKRVIQLGKSSDLSSFLHESAHLFLEMEKQLAAEFGLRPRQKAVLDFLGVNNFEELTVEQHEKYAETFEKYVETGNAPSTALRDAFAAFRRWMLTVYKGLDPRSRAKLTPEISDYFDRLLATDSEIEQMKGSPAFDELFRSAEQAGMTDAEWEKYQEQRQRASDKATSTVDEKLIKELTRRMTAEWKAEKQPIIEEEKERLRKEPVYMILGDIAANPMDYDAIVEATGEKPPGNMTGKAKKDGIDPELYAEEYGFPSVKAMIKAIAETPPLSKAADEAAETRMIATHGDTLNDGSIEQLARDAMHNEEQGKLLLTELRALDKNTKIDSAYLKTEAKRLIGGMKYADIKPGKFYRAEIKAAKRASAATDPAEIFQAKVQQAANHWLYKEAVETKDAMDRQRKYVKGVQSRKYNAKQVDPRYIQNMKAVANMYDMRQNTDRVISAISIVEWYQAQMGDPNQLIDITLLDPNLLKLMEIKATTGQIDYDYQMPTFDDLTADDLRGVYDQLRHLRFVGGMMSEEGNLEMAVERSNLAESIRANGGRDVKETRGVPEESMGVSTTTRRKLSHLVNKIPSLRNLVRKLDGFDEDGAAYNSIYRTVEEAFGRKLELQTELHAQYEEGLEDVHKIGLSQKRGDKKAYTLDNRSVLSLHSEGRFMMALYWGTESSREAIREGFGVTDKDVMMILSDLTVEQLNLVNTVWKINESVWPDLSSASVKQYGVAPPKLEPTPFEVNGVVMTGGHQRLFYDSTEVEAQAEKEKAGSQSEIMPTKAGSLHARVGSGGRPPLLDRNNIVRAVDDSIHFIAFAEAGNKLRMLINADEVKGSIERKHGVGFYKAVIEDIDGITGNGVARETIPYITKVMGHLRKAATFRHLAYSVRNVVQQFSAIPIAMQEVGFARYSSAVSRMMPGSRGRTELREFIESKSPFMANRTSLINREMSEHMRKMRVASKAGKAWDTVTSNVFILQTLVDGEVAFPTWLAKYEAAMEDHGNEAKAASAADTAVAESVGSGTDLHLGGAFQSSQNEITKTFTMFGSWFNAYYQRIYKSTHGGNFADADNLEMFNTVVLMPIIVGTLSAALIADGPGEDPEPEDWALWVAKQYGMFLTGTVPIIRDAAGAFKGFAPSTVWSAGGETPARTLSEISSYIEGNQSGLKFSSDIFKLFSTVIPVPGAGNVTRLMDYTDSYNRGGEGGTFNPYQALVEGPEKN